MREFLNPTRGKLSMQEVVSEIIDFMKEDENSEYKIVIGTDSKLSNGEVNFVTAIIIHRIGKGARFFLCRELKTQRNYSLKHLIYEEVGISLDVAYEFLERFSIFKEFLLKRNFEIHIDIGYSGPTREMIKEIVGYVTSNGFEAKIKPDSYGASCVADKYA